MEITGRAIRVDSVVCGQKIQTPVYDGLSPCWNYAVLHRDTAFELSVSVNQSCTVTFPTSVQSKK